MPNKNKRLVLVTDLERCIGCWTCSVACKAENRIGLGNWWNRVLTTNSKQETTGLPVANPDGSPDMEFRPVGCMHCENAPCVKACPTGATYKREDGIVAQNYDRCVGCRTCMAACPYNARTFNWEAPLYSHTFEDDLYGNPSVPPRKKGIVEKCTFCVERTDEGELPACVQGCLTKARFFGDLNDPESEVSRLISERNGSTYRPEFGTKPSVYYLPRRRRQTRKIGGGSS